MSILLPRRNRPHLHLNRKKTCQLSLIKTPTLYHHLVLPCIILRRTNLQKCEMTQSTKLFLLHISFLSRQDICAAMNPAPASFVSLPCANNTLKYYNGKTSAAQYWSQCMTIISKRNVPIDAAYYYFSFYLKA